MGGSHVLKFQRYFWTKSGSHPTASLNKRNKHLTGGRSLQCSWNSFLLQHEDMQRTLCSSQNPRLLPTGFVPRINCCSKICEWSHRQQHLRQAAKEPEAWSWDTHTHRAACLARVMSLGLSTEENLLETPPSIKQWYKNSELLRICSLPTGCLAKEDMVICSKIWINMDIILIVAKFGNSYVSPAPTTFHNWAIGPMPFPCKPIGGCHQSFI